MKPRGNGDIGGIANTATARTSAEAGALAARAEAATRARGNLAAILCSLHGVDPATASADDPAVRQAAVDLAELGAILGLDRVPARRPGYCTCGARLTLAASAVSGTAGSYIRGCCSACGNAAREVSGQ